MSSSRPVFFRRTQLEESLLDLEIETEDLRDQIERNLKRLKVIGELIRRTKAELAALEEAQ